jgi:hypothetical protein
VTTQLPERLRDLADEAPGPLSASGLWQEGRRRHRRRIITATAVVGAVVAITAGAGYGDWRSRQPDPAAPPATDSGPMAIPDRFYDPSPWLPSSGSPGRLVAIMDDVPQHHVIGGPTEGLVGVAAGSQRYTFVALPGRVEGTSAYLAPDGRHLAYVIGGTVAKERHDDAGGVAVLDLISGEVDRYPIRSQHGLNMVGARWTSPGGLLVQVTRERDAPPHANYGSVAAGGAYRLDVGAQRLVRLPVRIIGYDDEQVAMPTGAAMVSEKRVDLLDPETGRSIRHFRLTKSIGASTALDVSSMRIAGLRRGGSPELVLTGHVVDGVGVLHTVPGGVRFSEVLTWLDRRHVLTDRDLFFTRQNAPAATRQRLVSLDVRTGHEETLSVFPAGDLQVAREALEHPRFTRGIAPPRPWNLRVLAFTVVSLLGLIVFIGWATQDSWRPRVRR